MTIQLVGAKARDDIGNALRRHGMTGYQRITIGDAVRSIAKQACEVGFVAGDCNTPENAEFLADVSGNEPCWPCYARKVLKAFAPAQAAR